MNPALPPQNPVASLAPASPGALPGAQPPQFNLPVANYAPPPAFNNQAMLDAVRNYFQIPEQASAAAQSQSANLKAGNVNATIDNSNNRANQEYAQRVDYEKKVKAQQDAEKIASAAHARAQKMAELKLDANAYEKRMNPQTGGIDIFDPISGQKVNIGDYVRITGANPADILKQSRDPRDRQFVKDATNFDNFMKAYHDAQAGDQKAKATLQTYYDNPKNGDLRHLNIDDTFQAYKQLYGDYYGFDKGPDVYHVKGFTPTNALSAAQQQDQMTNSPFYQANYAGQGQINNSGNSGQFGNVNVNSLQPKWKPHK